MTLPIESRRWPWWAPWWEVLKLAAWGVAIWWLFGEWIPKAVLFVVLVLMGSSG